MNHQLSDMPRLLIDWFQSNARELPWRVSPSDRERGKRPVPYHVWLSEIMLQQTTVKHAIPYFNKFIKRWPSLDAFASADNDEVMSLWAGLGYYARARNLLRCAKAIRETGEFPRELIDLKKLPGVGEYTAAAIASIAFGKPVVAIDTNVERVFSRLLALETPWTSAKKDIRRVASELVPNNNPNEFSEGLMDLGATICTSKNPECSICPIQRFCKASHQGNPESFPRKPSKPPRPSRYGNVFFLVDGDDVLLERRDEKGLLGGMLGFPCSDWTTDNNDNSGNQEIKIAKADWQFIGEVKHVFTHFELTLAVHKGRLLADRPNGIWKTKKRIDGLPTLFKKVYRLAANTGV